MKKIIVTGGLGFIGSHTVIELVNAGYEPIIIDNLINSEKFILESIEKIVGRKIAFYEVDCCDKNANEEVIRKEGQIRGLIHFAALKAVNESVNFPLKYYKNNIESLLNVIEVCEKFSIQNFVFSSSCTVYGQPDVLPVTEQTEYGEITSPYGNTKRMCEEILRDYSKTSKDIKVISLRYFNPIGAHPSGLIGELPKGIPSNLVPFIMQTAIGILPELKIFGDNYNTEDGTCIRDFIHVIDLAKAHVKSIDFLENHSDAPFYDVFNVGTGKGTSVMELINKFQEINNVPINFKIVERREGDIESIYAATKKINEILGWKSRLTVAECLKDAWNWQLKLGKS